MTIDNETRIAISRYEFDILDLLHQLAMDYSGGRIVDPREYRDALKFAYGRLEDVKVGEDSYKDMKDYGDLDESLQDDQLAISRYTEFFIPEALEDLHNAYLADQIYAKDYADVLRDAYNALTSLDFSDTPLHEAFGDKIEIDTSAPSCIVGFKMEDGSMNRYFYNEETDSWSRNPDDATTWTDLDTARDVWSQIDKTGFRRVFVPLFQKELFESRMLHEKQVPIDKWYSETYPDDPEGASQLAGLYMDDALADRSIIANCNNLCKERVNKQLDKYVPLLTKETEDELDSVRYYVYDDYDSCISDGFEYMDDAIDWAKEHDHSVVKAHKYYRDDDGGLNPDGDPEIVFELREGCSQLNEANYTDYEDWDPADIELHKSIDWKARNYTEYPVPEDSFTSTAIAFTNDGSVKKDVKFIKYIRPNPIFPPYYAPETDPFDELGVVGPMADGHHHGVYDIHDRYESQEIYDSMFESCKYPNGQPVTDLDLDKALDYQYGTDRDPDNDKYTDAEKQRAVDYWMKKTDPSPYVNEDYLTPFEITVDYLKQHEYPIDMDPEDIAEEICANVFDCDYATCDFSQDVLNAIEFFMDDRIDEDFDDEYEIKDELFINNDEVNRMKHLFGEEDAEFDDYDDEF